MKLLFEVLVSVILHPIAMLLMILNLIGRSDIDGGKKLVWTLVALLWGIGPILYITVGDGSLW
jgi:Phospholipase_D-nuclease N-terminal